MSSLNLTAEEIEDITGLKRASAQIRHLRSLGLTVKQRADGSPLVSRANYHVVMGGTVAGSRHEGSEPDFGAIRRATKA